LTQNRVAGLIAAESAVNFERNVSYGLVSFVEAKQSPINLVHATRTR